MVSSISSINKYPMNREQHEVIRRLQSLGVAPSGNLTFDRQHLQTAELRKKQITLASNSEANLNRLEGTGRDFSATIKNIGINEVETGTGNITALKQDMVSAGLAYKMVGANQIAELNKYRLGLSA